MADKSPSIGAIENALDELIDEMTDDDVLGMIAEDVSEPFQVELEEDLFHDYELYTLFKPNTDNYNKYSQRYNLICRQLERIGDKKAIAELIRIRYAARRTAMEHLSMELLDSPYSDAGAAILYGYVEGVKSRIETARDLNAASSGAFVTRTNPDGTKTIESVQELSAIGLVNGDF